MSKAAEAVVWSSDHAEQGSNGMPRRWTVTTLLGIVSLGLLIAVSGGYSATAAARHKYALADDSGTTTTGSAPVNASLPRISGEARQGTPLNTSDGSWDNSPDSYTYQWRRCGSGGGNCSNISGATSNAYVLRAADVSHTIRIVVTASNSLGSASATSARTAVVLSETAPPLSWNGLGCMNYDTRSRSNIVCNYNDLVPFLLTGHINGPGTLTYKVQCQNKGKVKPKVLFSRSKGVKKGSFKVRGVEAAEKAAIRCGGGYKKGPALTVTLKLGNGASGGKIAITLDGTMPWGK